MFEIGDYVIYGNEGVCKIENIGPMKLTGALRKKLYYTLVPLYTRDSKVYTPVDNEKIIMRSILTKDEAIELIDNIEDIDILWVPEEKNRETIFKEALKTCECKELIKIIKTLYLKKENRLAEGKKITASDEKYLHLAEDKLYEELAISLDMKKENMVDYIAARVSDNKDNE